MREQTFDSTNAAPSPFSCATSLQAAATIRLSFLERGWTMPGHAHCEVNENEHNLVPRDPRYFESIQKDMRLSFFISKRQINLKEYLVNAFPHGIEGDIEI